jgi:hypothetical protein
VRVTVEGTPANELTVEVHNGLSPAVTATPLPDIVRAIRLVAAGEPMLSPSVMRQMMSYVAAAAADPRRARARESLSRLSDGERAVAGLIGRGKDQRRDRPGTLDQRRDGEGVRVTVADKLELNNRVQVALLVHDADPADPGR